MLFIYTVYVVVFRCSVSRMCGFHMRAVFLRSKRKEVMIELQALALQMLIDRKSVLCRMTCIYKGGYLLILVEIKFQLLIDRLLEKLFFLF